MKIVDCDIDYEKLKTGGWCNDHQQESWICKKDYADMTGWIGIDFDGTLATYDRWQGELQFGEPIWPMVEFVKKLLAEGRTVKIFTARVSEEEIRDKITLGIQRWLVEKAGLPPLDVTNVKDYAMDELYDDRAVQVEKNTGKIIGYSPRGLL